MAKAKTSAAVEPTTTSTPTSIEKVSKRKGKKETIEEETPVETPLVETPVAETQTETLTENKTDDLTTVERISNLQRTVTMLASAVRVVSTELRKISRDYAKDIREASRHRRTARRQTNEDGTVRQPSGFQKPVPISDALADFLGLPHGSSMARNAVTKMISAYVKENGLQNSENKRIIVPDAKLKRILGKLVHPIDKNDPSKGTGVTYFTLQKYLAPHFLKSEVTVSA